MSGLLSIRNRQRACRVDTVLLRRITLRLLRLHLPERGFELCLHLVAAPEMARVNRTFLQHEGSTDVITFDHAEPGRAERPAAPARPLHGEIYLCLNEAVAQARAFATSWPAELVRYVVHGILHLCGHDDLEPSARRRMKRVENRLVRQLAREFNLGALARRKPRTARGSRPGRPARPARAARPRPRPRRRAAPVPARP